MKFTTQIKPPCKCGHNRFRTYHKQSPSMESSVYLCRKCGCPRYVTREQWENERS